MPIKPKHVIVAGLTIVGLSLVTAVAKASHTGKKLEIKLHPKIEPRLTTTTVWIDATVTNPTSGSLLIFDPVIRLSRNGQEIKTVDLTGQHVTLLGKSKLRLSAPKGQGGLGGYIRIDLNTADLIAMFPDAIASIMGTGPKFEIVVDITMQVKAPNLPRVNFSQSETITL